MFASLNDAPRWWAFETPDEHAIVFGEDTVSYHELDQWVDRAALLLHAEGIEVGDRVAVVGLNSVEWVVAALAALRCGAVVTGINHRFVAREIAYAIEQYEPRVVLAAESHRGRVEEVLKSTDAKFVLRPLSDVTDVRIGETVRFKEPALDRDHPAVIVSTSGTTGMPKGATLTHGGLLSGMLEWAIMEPAWGHKSRFLGILPMAPFGGLCWSVLPQLMWGGTVFLEPEFNPKRALQLLVDEKITVMSGAVVMFELIAALPEFAAADLSALTTATVGGSPVPVELLSKWQERGALLRQTYGLTEAGGPIQATSKHDAIDFPDRCGRRPLHRKVRIVRPDGTDCDANEPGEIIVGGAAVTPGYWNSPETTAVVLKDGWFHTGDLGELDELGFLKVTGRLVEMIISGGFNIGPAEIEHVVGGLPQVTEVAALGVPDPKFGETPAVVVHLRESIEVADIIEHCNKHLADYKVPRYVIVSNEPLPRNQSGKIVKHELRERYPDIPGTFPRVR